MDEAGSFFRVSTGKVEAYVPKRGSCLLDSLRCEGRTVGGQAALLCSTQDHPSAGGEAVLHFTDYRGQVERVTVERAGDVRALVRIEGRYANDATGRKWLPFTVRFYFYAGSEQIKMVHSFVFDGDMDRDFIRSLGIRFEVPMREASRFGIMNTDDQGRILEFEEKPQQPKSNLASMGIYNF